jgi:uncharacterized damage-inducible protein DinB
MKEILVQLSAYNVWANRTITDLLQTLPEEKLQAELQSSFPTLFRTTLHILDAESIWWQRIKLQERILVPSENFSGDIKELAWQIRQQDLLWHQWLMQANDHVMEHVFQYSNSKREQFKQPIFQALLQVFNHGTYHRGQIVTMLRQAGITKIPATDFVLWSRKPRPVQIG